MKKKLVTLCAALALCATAIIGGTLAYFTDTDAKDNTFTVGNVDIELTEPNWNAAETAGTHTNVYPGQKLDKDPTVKNIGANDCYVRISVSNLNQFGAEYGIAYWTGNVKDALGTDWELHEGYYYYKNILSPEAKTSALFDQIQVPVELTNNQTVEGIEVKAEAVQAQGLKDNPTVAEIAAWFATCGL